MVSKSANYCFCTRDNNTGLLLLSEVTLGDMYEKKHAEYVERLPKGNELLCRVFSPGGAQLTFPLFFFLVRKPGKLSTKGLGRTEPDPKQEVKMDNGTIVPLGPGQDSGIRDTSLQYNECQSFLV